MMLHAKFQLSPTISSGAMGSPLVHMSLFGFYCSLKKKKKKKNQKKRRKKRRRKKMKKKKKKAKREVKLE